MTQYPHQIRHAPQGMNNVIDRPQMPLNRCEGIRGFLPARHGVLNPAFPVYQQPNVTVPLLGASIEGLAFYMDLPGSAFASRSDYLIVVRDGGIVYSHKVGYIANPPSQTPLVKVGAGVSLGNLQDTGMLAFNTFGTYNVRSAQLRDELFIVQDQGGTIPKRIVKGSDGILRLLQCGINTPVGADFALTDGGAGAMAAGTFDYRITFADEKFRESSPSVTESITQIINKKVTNTITWPTDPQIKYAYMYRKAQGTGADYYRITPDGLSVDYLTRTAAATLAGNDNTTEANLVTGELAPNPGQNDPPLRANMVCVHKDRLCFNDRSILTTPTNYLSQDTVQMSNVGAPTQFSVTGTVDTPDEGTGLIIGSEQGDEVMGIISYGSLLFAFKRNSTYVVYGDDLSDFEVRREWARGAVATDTIGEYDGLLGFMASDGYYASSGGVPAKISGEIDAFFTGYSLQNP